MAGPDGRRSHLRGSFWRESPTEEVTEELSFHVEMRAHELAAAGMELEEARRVARESFIDLQRVQAECADIAGSRDRQRMQFVYWSEFLQDVRYACRQIRAAPGFSLLVVATLGLAISATTMIFSAVHAVVLRPPAFSEPERVHMISESWKGGRSDVSPAVFVELERNATLYSAVAAINWGNHVVADGDGAARLGGAAVTSDYFGIYGVRPAHGRLFSAADGQPGAPRAVVLSHGTWAARYNSDPAVVGTDIRVDGEPSRIIGVLPPHFNPLLVSEELYFPLQLTPEHVAARGSRWLHVVGRAAPGADIVAVRHQLDGIANTLRQAYPADNADRGLMAQPIQQVLVGDYRGRLFLLMGAVLVVLLIACANVANLLLARGAGREKELSVRSALGAGRSRILRQLLTENLILSAATVAVSLLVAGAGVRVMRAVAPADVPRIGEATINPVVLVFALLIGVVSSLMFGLVPALRATRADLQAALRSGGRDSASAPRDSLRNALVCAEVALSVMLLIGAGLLIRTSMNVAAVDPGFRMDGVVSARVTLPENAYASSERVQAAFYQLIEHVATAPGVTAAAVTSLPPLGPGGNEMFLNAEGSTMTNEDAVVARLRVTSSDYHRALDIPVTRGRMFDARDVRDGELVAVITEELARVLWPGQDPLGRRFACCEESPDGPVFKTVIGVVADVRSQSPTDAPQPEFFLPLAQVPPDAWEWLGRSMTIVAAGPADAAQLAGAIRGGVAQVDASVPIYDLATLHDNMRAVTAPARFNTVLMSLLGVLGLALAVSGIYSVVSFSVAQRHREIGLRVALGASSGSVLSLLVRQALFPVAAGLLLGTAAALFGARLLSAALFDVSPTDPATYGIVITGLLAVALAAVILPALRAARVQPTVALRG